MNAKFSSSYRASIVLCFSFNVGEILVKFLQPKKTERRIKFYDALRCCYVEERLQNATVVLPIFRESFSLQ